jgi:lipopolysaccharide export system protein LptA
MFAPRNSGPRRSLAVALALAVLTCSAHAEKADKDKPINLEADRVNIDDAKKVSVFEGNVVLTQGTLQIRADRLVVREDAQGFSYGVAYGNLVTFRQKREGVDEYVEGQAERIEYDGKAERVQLFNRAQMKRGADEIRGSYISYDQPTEFFRVTGGPDDQAGKPGAGRVRAIIQPKNKDKDKPREAAPALQLKPAPALTDAKKQ